MLYLLLKVNPIWVQTYVIMEYTSGGDIYESDLFKSYLT